MNKLTALASELNPKQKRFTELLAKGVKQVDAYIESGYQTARMKPKTIESAARRCKCNVRVKAYYDALQAESTQLAMTEIVFDKKDWLKNQLHLLAMAMGEKPTKLTAVFQGEFYQQELNTVDLTAAFKAQEQLGKMLALFTDKNEVSADFLMTNLIADISKEAGESENDSPLPKDHL